MSTLKFGEDPHGLTVNLTRGGSWTVTLRNVNAAGVATPWVGVNSLALRVGPSLWSATITETDAVFAASAADVAAVVASDDRTAVLWMNTDVAWAIGTVEVNG